MQCSTSPRSAASPWLKSHWPGVLHNPVVSAPIIVSTKARHLSDAVAALEIELTDDEMTWLDRHYTPRQSTCYGSTSGF